MIRLLTKTVVLAAALHTLPAHAQNEVESAKGQLTRQTNLIDQIAHTTERQDRHVCRY